MSVFAYPKVDNCNKFEGIGIFKSALPESMKNVPKYQKLNSERAEIKNVLIAVTILCKSAFDSPKGVYQQKNDHLNSIGNSMQLSLFLSEVNRARKLKAKLNIEKIWATGCIIISGNTPLLSIVLPKQFDEKLKAFALQSESLLFIIPKSNYDSDQHDSILEKHKIKKLSLKEFNKISNLNLCSNKILLCVQDNELKPLMNSLFVTRLRDRLTLKYFAIYSVIVFLLIFTLIGTFFFKQYWKQKILNREALRFYHSIFNELSNIIPPYIFNQEILPYGYHRNSNIEYIGSCMLANDGTIIGNIAFHYYHSNNYLVLNCSNGSIEKVSTIDRNKFFEYQFDIYDLNARIMTQDYKLSNSLKEQIEIKISKNNKSFSHKKSETVFVVSNNNETTIQKIKPLHDNSINMPFVWIPGGCFVQQSNSKIQCLNGFWMAKHEVTQGQWKMMMKNNPSFFNNCGNDCPVESISWRQANEFIDQFNLSQNENYSLPTDMEWDFAYGMISLDPPTFTDDLKSIYPRCYFGEEKNGLCDMKANVSEWCDDSKYTEETTKPVRGFSYNTPIELINHQRRYHQDKQQFDLGFRIVRRIE
ncbi:membrane protein containing Sulphatase-modifying factor domain protein [Candidatus Magnetomorum sp. HK-1]|nr:membrane protein containing Sulphatase-modifying factor domain protein [Candidatus Magnetomorum sp. HK-1]